MSPVQLQQLEISPLDCATEGTSTFKPDQAAETRNIQFTQFDKARIVDSEELKFNSTRTIKPGGLLNARTDYVTPRRNFARSKTALPHETPEFIRRRSTLRRTHFALDDNDDYDDRDVSAVDSLVRKTDDSFLSRVSCCAHKEASVIAT